MNDMRKLMDSVFDLVDEEGNGQEEQKDLYALVVADGYLAAAGDSASQLEQLAQHYYSDDDYEIVELIDVPADVAERLESQGASDQYYDDGYEAMEAARPYEADREGVKEGMSDRGGRLPDDKQAALEIIDAHLEEALKEARILAKGTKDPQFADQLRTIAHAIRDLSKKMWIMG